MARDSRSCRIFKEKNMSKIYIKQIMVGEGENGSSTIYLLDNYGRVWYQSERLEGRQLVRYWRLLQLPGELEETK